MSEPFTGVTIQEEADRISALIQKHPQLVTYLGQDFLDSLMKVGQNTEEVHPLFFYLQNDWVNENFAKALIELSGESGFKSYVEVLKSRKEFATLISTIREVEAFYFFKVIKKIEVVWKPNVAGKGEKGPDLLLKTPQPIYLEILTITDEKEEVEKNKVQNRLYAAINKLSDNPYLVRIKFEQPFKMAMLPEATDCITEAINHAKSQNLDDYKTEFQQNDQVIFSLELMKLPDGGKGKWIATHHRGQGSNASMKIKNKLLNKVEEFQLPPKQTETHLNGYLIFLEPISYTGHDLISAVMGQHQITFSLPTNDERQEPKFGHKDNGVTHHRHWSDNKIGENLDFIAATKAIVANGPFHKETSMLLTSEDLTITRDELSDTLFIG